VIDTAKMSKADELFSKMIDLAIERPEMVPEKVLFITGDMESISKILSPARMKLMAVISRKKPKNIGELAEEVGRPLQSVSRDLAVLRGWGFIEFVRSGREKTVRLEKDMIMIPLTS